MRLPLLFICMTITLDAMGIGLIMPVMPELLQIVGNVDLSQAASIGGYLTVVYAINQFIFGPLLGNLSDRYGRRPVLLISLLVMMIDYMIMGFAPTLVILFIGRFIAGIAGATISTAHAYIADISSDEDKAKNFGLVGAAFGIGFILGPLLGGLLGELGPRAPFFAAAALAGLNMLFGYFILPESLPASDRRPFEWLRANPLGGLLKVGEIPGILPLLGVLFLQNLANFVYPSVWAFWGRAQMGWETSTVGLSLAMYGFWLAMVQIFLVGRIVKRFGERSTAMFGFAVAILSFGAYPFITSTLLLFLLVPVAALSGLVMPALQGMMTRAVRRDQQGELQGLAASVMAIATIITPYLMTQIFRIFTEDGAPVYLPGAPFLLAALFTLGALVMLLFWRAPATSRI